LNLTLVVWIRGLTLSEYFQERDPLAGVGYYLMLLVFAAMPFFVAHKAGFDYDSLHS